MIKKNDLFDFKSFFARTFLNFLAHYETDRSCNRNKKAYLDNHELVNVVDEILQGHLSFRPHCKQFLQNYEKNVK